MLLPSESNLESLFLNSFFDTILTVGGVFGFGVASAFLTSSFFLCRIDGEVFFILQMNVKSDYIQNIKFIKSKT
jgi:arginine exporter protein ArgO